MWKPNVSIKEDVCLDLKYKLGANSDIQFQYNDNAPFYLPRKEYVESNEARVCLSHLTGHVDVTSSAIKIISDIKNNGFAQMEHVTFTKTGLLASSSFFTFSEEMDLRSYFPSNNIIPQYSWESTKNEIVCKGKIINFIYLKFNNNYTKIEDEGSSIILSNWIRSFIPGMKLRFTIDNYLKNSKEISIDIFSFDAKMQRYKTDMVC